MVKTKTIYLLSLIFFTSLLFVVPARLLPSDLGNTILTIVTFLFGLIAGFYIVVTTTDYNSVKALLSNETAGWISLFHTTKIYDPRLTKKLSARIEKLIIRAFDYELLEYTEGTTEEFESLQAFVDKLPYRTSRSSIHQVIQTIMSTQIQYRQQLIVLGTKTLSSFSWLILFVLGSLVTSSLYAIRTGELFFDVIAVLLSSSLVLILLLIHDLDLYIWNEKTFGYDIFENALRAIGKLPYYPKESIEKGRVIPVESVYRLGMQEKTAQGMRRRFQVVRKKNRP